MNVGCNKGHDSIAWLQRFDQHRFWNLRRLKFQQQMRGKNDGDGDSYVGVDVEDAWSHRSVSYELEKSSICAHVNVRFHNFEDPKLFFTLFFFKSWRAKWEGVHVEEMEFLVGNAQIGVLIVPHPETSTVSWQNLDLFDGNVGDLWMMSGSTYLVIGVDNCWLFDLDLTIKVSEVRFILIKHIMIWIQFMFVWTSPKYLCMMRFFFCQLLLRSCCVSK